MQHIKPQSQANTDFQKKILSRFEQSLTEEQRFLQSVLNNEIKTYSHKEVIADLRKVLKR